MPEKWKPVDISDGEYEISDAGRFRKIIGGTRHGSGYILYNTHQNGAAKRIYAHRLVAQYFLNGGEVIPSSMYVDHLNGIRDDNRVSNLRIVEPAINAENLAVVREAMRRDILNELGITDNNAMPSLRNQLPLI